VRRVGIETDRHIVAVDQAGEACKLARIKSCAATGFDAALILKLREGRARCVMGVMMMHHDGALRRAIAGGRRAEANLEVKIAVT
jgi:hypothetical protein